MSSSSSTMTTDERTRGHLVGKVMNARDDGSWTSTNSGAMLSAKNTMTKTPHTGNACGNVRRLIGLLVNSAHALRGFPGISISISTDPAKQRYFEATQNEPKSKPWSYAHVSCLCRFSRDESSALPASHFTREPATCSSFTRTTSMLEYTPNAARVTVIHTGTFLL